jgi:hypothetical protein
MNVISVDVAGLALFGLGSVMVLGVSLAKATVRAILILSEALRWGKAPNPSPVNRLRPENGLQ